MRKLAARGFLLEFVSFVALIVSIALAWLGHLLNLPDAVVITASLGLSLAAFSWALKYEVKKEFRERLSIYSLLEAIEYQDLYDRGRVAIEECRKQLENLSEGILRIDLGHVARCMIEYTSAAKHHVRMTHIVRDEDRLEMVQPGPDNTWYQHNLDLVERGVVVERLFIMRRKDAIDSSTGKLHPGYAKILLQQASDGIEVGVVWE